MKKDIHPSEYRPVVFQDTSTGFTFLTSSTAHTEEKIKWEDGKEYPLIKVHISSNSHPFYTGKEKLVDIEGRVDRFRSRSEAARKHREQLQTKAPKKKATKASSTSQKIGAKSGKR